MSWKIPPNAALISVKPKRKREAETLSAPFVLIDNVYDAEDAAEIAEFYADALERISEPDPDTEPEYRMRQRGEGKYDVEFDEHVEFTGTAEERLRELLRTEEQLEPAEPSESPSEWIFSKPHALVTLAGAKDQPMHTDVEPLFRGGTVTPEFYYTLLVNVGDGPVTPDMGPTEFEAADGENPRPLLQPNQGVLFSGRVRHRGTASTVARVPTVYIVLRRSWFRDLNEEQFELLEPSV